MKDFHDRLLDASLKEYSRVAMPENFVVRSPATRRRWVWWIAPVAAVAVAAAVVMMLRPAPIPAPPARITIAIAAPAVTRVPRIPGVAKAEALHSHYRTLTASEMAKLDLPAELFAPRVEQPITDLQITELVVTPLEITDALPKPKE